MTDADLVRRAREGDAEAFTLLVERYRDAIYGLALHELQAFEDARDVAQEAFIQAYRHLDQFRDPRLAPHLTGTIDAPGAPGIFARKREMSRKREPSARNPMEFTTETQRHRGRQESGEEVHDKLNGSHPSLSRSVSLYY